MKSIVKHWYAKNPLLILLLPFSYLYEIIFIFHKLIYWLGIKKRFISPVPVVIVGNITVGGTGKTPFTIALAKILLQRGYQPGIISRGYKGKSKDPVWVTKQSDPAFVGDESILISRETECPVVVSAKRSEAIKMLLDKSNCNIVLSDDGLQHHALKRDIEIVIVDGDRKFGNSWCLPAGPLREPMSKLSKVDFIVYNDNCSSHHYSMSLKANEIYNLLNKDMKFSSKEFKGTINAVAAIGNPDRFFNTLKAMNINFKTHIYNDHHEFKLKDFKFCKTDDAVIMTEKDAVKCQTFAKPNFWVLPVSAEINQEFIHDFFVKLDALMLALTPTLSR